MQRSKLPVRHPSFDHLVVRSGEERSPQVAEDSRVIIIDRQLKLGRLHDR